MHKTKRNELEYIYRLNDDEAISLVMNERFRQIEACLRSLAPENILELGCGNGSFAKILRDKLSVRVSGVDLSESGVALTRQKGIEAEIADLNKRIPFPDNVFDLVYSDQLFEHVNDTDKLLSESRRVLKNGGYLVIITPNLSFWLNRIIMLLGLYPLFTEISTKNKTYGMGFLKKFMKETEAMGHLRVANVPALSEMVRENGFSLVKIEGLPLSWNLPKILKIFYDLIDRTAAKNPNLARDIFLIAQKT
jgi:methionine biosynthesis protein MetW